MNALRHALVYNIAILHLSGKTKVIQCIACHRESTDICLQTPVAVLLRVPAVQLHYKE